MSRANPSRELHEEPLTREELDLEASALTYARRVNGPDVLLSILAVLVAPAGAVVLMLLAGAALGQGWLTGMALPAATVVGGIGMWAGFLRRGWTWADLGFVRGIRSLWHLLWEVPLLWLSAVAATVLIGTLAGLSPSESDSASEDALELGVVAFLLTALCIALLIPALEEILFRRILFGWFELRWGVVGAITGSTVAFGLVHVVPAVILLQLLIGLGAGILVRVHRTLWASLALHGLNNAVVTAGAAVILL